MIAQNFPHQYVDRATVNVVTEKLIGDRSVNFLYNNLRENSPALFRALTSRRMSGLLGFIHYDFFQAKNTGGARRLFGALGADWSECVEPLSYFDSRRKVFERKIRYWESRPMEPDGRTLVAPADSRVLIGGFTHASSLFIKNKFFEIGELLGLGCPCYPRFIGCEYAVFRLTPDKYHHNHVPVNGKVVDFYAVDGRIPAAGMSEAALPPGSTGRWWRPTSGFARLLPDRAWKNEGMAAISGS